MVVVAHEAKNKIAIERRSNFFFMLKELMRRKFFPGLIKMMPEFFLACPLSLMAIGEYYLKSTAESQIVLRG